MASPAHVQDILFPQALASRSVESAGWLPQQRGLALPPGGKGTLRLACRRNPQQQFLLDLPLSRLEDVAVQITLETEQETIPVFVSKPGTDPYDLTDELQGTERFGLRVEVEDRRGSGSPEVLLEHVVLLEQARLFPAARVAYTAGDFAMGYGLACSFLATASEAAVTFPFTIGGWVILHAVGQRPMDVLAREIFLVLAVLLAYRRFRQGGASALESPAGLTILLVALDVRWEQLELLRARALDPDPENFLRLALRSSAFIDTEVREPLFLFCVKAGTWLFGPGPFSIRLTTVLLSLGVVLVAWRAGRDLFSTPVGLLTALFLALHRNFIFVNVRGYRLELYTLLLLCFTWFGFGKREWPTGRRAAALAVAGALACLTRVNTYSSLALLVVILFLRDGWPKRHLVLVLVVPILALTPSFVYWHQRYGDAMVAVNIHLKYYRNIEFADHPLIPKGADPYRGPDTDSFRYFLGEWHTPYQTLEYVVTGLQEIFMDDYGWRYLFHGIGWFMALTLLGLARWAVSRHWLLLLWVFLLVAPVAFFQRISLDFRLILHILPFLSFALMDLLECLFRHGVASSSSS